jgi:hypothetical protein
LLVTTIEKRTDDRRRRIRRWVMWGSLAIPLAAVIVYLLIWYGPDLIARHDIGNVKGPLRVFRMQQARDAARGRLLTLGAGLFAAGALLFTGRNFGLSRRTLEVSQRTLELTEQGQVTDRYTKAIGQLGSSTIDVTIGGIYALERIAHDSPRDHPTVMEVLAACIREHSPEQWPPVPSGEPSAELPERTTRPDIQAALTVIGRRDTTHDRQPINLADANLTRANLTDADLARAILTGAILTGANLTDANLIGANLTRANLTRANLTHADLARANLGSAVLAGGNLTGANLTGANLTGANLMRADLANSNLTGTLWPADTAVPDGWERSPSTEGRLWRARTGTGAAN